MDPNSSDASDNERITLQVGERRFTTLRHTLVSESSYFAGRLSGRWTDADEDGSYFIDSDPALFEHILRYLRSGNFPFFFDTATQTFDLAKYTALLGEARYFGIRKLEEWIENNKYLDLVHLEKSVFIFPDAEDTPLRPYISVRPNTKTEVTTSWRTQKIYICPREIPVHRGNRSLCGQACEKARQQGSGEVEYEDEPILSAVVITTKVILNHMPRAD
ncbi:hypothetical protein F5Y06DRAFT_255254 [Hypoxylon sp. FL0890]|nr:hypothetical protein F5Y06DRAFT_255254 [Hypoxylon sp. FL0890]